MIAVSTILKFLCPELFHVTRAAHLLLNCGDVDQLIEKSK